LCSFQAGADNAVADTGVGQGEAAGLFFRRKLGGNNIEQPAMHPGIGQVGRDASAHGSGTQYGDIVDLRSIFHGFGDPFRIRNEARAVPGHSR